ncbi:hypothetical protein PspLS_02002 [Pyricularia sp. CBS 133598]|nr:hypothetical protein PspLS_02002 [Pyricularia sp. CBS 133598]
MAQNAGESVYPDTTVSSDGALRVTARNIIQFSNIEYAADGRTIQAAGGPLPKNSRVTRNKQQQSRNAVRRLVHFSGLGDRLRDMATRRGLASPCFSHTAIESEYLRFSTRSATLAVWMPLWCVPKSQLNVETPVACTRPSSCGRVRETKKRQHNIISHGALVLTSVNPQLET